MRRILFVDDEAFNIHAVRNILQLMNLEADVIIESGSSGLDTVKVIQTAANRGNLTEYVLIISDCSMPFLDGYEAAKRIRETSTPGSRLN